MKGKKNQSRRGKGKRRGQGIPSTLAILPVAFKKVFCAYTAAPSLSEGAAGAGALYQFRLNSLYDPDFTGTGTTASGYTNLSNMFGLFRVVKARVIVQCANTTGGTTICGFLVGLNGTVSSNFLLLQHEPHATSRQMQGNTGGAHSLSKFDRTVNMSRVCGMTRAQYMNEADFAHIGGANPARSVYLTCYMVGQSATAQTVQFNVRIIYEVEVSNPLQTVVN